MASIGNIIDLLDLVATRNEDVIRGIGGLNETYVKVAKQNWNKKLRQRLERKIKVVSVYELTNQHNKEATKKRLQDKLAKKQEEKTT